MADGFMRVFNREMAVLEGNKGEKTAEDPLKTLNAQGLEWVLYLVKGDCMHFFEQGQMDNFNYFRTQYKNIKNEYELRTR